MATQYFNIPKKRKEKKIIYYVSIFFCVFGGLAGYDEVSR